MTPIDRRLTSIEPSAGSIEPSDAGLGDKPTRPPLGATRASPPGRLATSRGARATMQTTVNRARRDRQVRPPESLDRSVRRDVTWLARPVTVRRGGLGALLDNLPRFRRYPFGRNRHLDLIVREGRQDQRPVPVATVSKRYELLQHATALETLTDGMRQAGQEAEAVDASVTLSEYGERMYARAHLPDFGVDPDGLSPITLTAECLNSVDKSTPFVVRLAWHRLVCSNGMMFGIGESGVRKIHSVRSTSAGDVAGFLKQCFDRVTDEHTQFRKWLATRVDRDQLRDWADEPVREAWGPHLAARAFHIARTGWDGQIEGRFHRVPSSEIPLRPTQQIPGAAAPVTTAFHDSQVLSWLAKERKTLQDQLDKIMQIPLLMQQLLN